MDYLFCSFDIATTFFGVYQLEEHDSEGQLSVLVGRYDTFLPTNCTFLSLLVLKRKKYRKRRKKGTSFINVYSLSIQNSVDGAPFMI
jgi:hypothetical protein